MISKKAFKKLALSRLDVHRLSKVKKTMRIDALTTAFCEVAPKRLSQPHVDKQSKSKI